MNTYSESSNDEVLIARAAAGDSAAFGDLYNRHKKHVHRFVFQMTGSATVADDVTQEVFMTLIDKMSDFTSDRGTFSGYLFGITRKHLLRHFERWRPEVSLHTEQQDMPEWTPESLIDRSDPLNSVSREETVDAVRRAVLALPPRYREIVVLCDFNEMSYEEAAAAVGCAIGTVRSRLHRARSLLLKRLSTVAEDLPASIRKAKGCLA